MTKRYYSNSIFIVVFISMIISTMTFSQSTLEIKNKSTKYFPKVALYGALKNQNGRYFFPQKLEQNITVKDVYGNYIIQPKFQQNIQSAESLDTSNLNDEVENSGIKSNVVIIFDASSAAMNVCGNRMKEIAIRIIRTIDFENGDVVAFIRAGTYPTRIHSNTWLNGPDTAGLIQYILDTLSSDANFDFVNAFYGKDESMLGVKPAEPNDLGLFTYMSDEHNHRIAFCITGINEPSNPAKTSGQSGAPFALMSRYGIGMHTIFYHNGEYDTRAEFGADSLMKWKQFEEGYHNQNWGLMHNVDVTMSDEQMDSAHSIITDLFQEKYFQHRFGAMSIEVPPTTISMKPDSFAFDFSSGLYGFEENVKVKNPALNKVSFNFNDESIKVYPNPTTQYVTFEMSVRNLVEIYSINGTLVKNGYTNELIDVHTLGSGTYYSHIAGSIKKFIIQ